ncbi:MAG TPA: thiamine pyrophosphate-dependent enzyme [Planctomycetota bacterium]|nr:thiamine pyrophosphate-dependent enzyme [Planctomycetota bacterium]
MTDTLQQILDPTGNKVGKPPRLSKEVLLRMHRAIVQTRHFDDRCMKLQRTGKIGFSIPNLGIEAVSVGAAAALDASKDWIEPSYRAFGMLFFHGVTAESMMDTQFGNVDDNSVGRQMPVHFSYREPIRVLSISSPIGTHLPQAVGISLAAKKRGEDAVSLVSFGDGGTSSLGFHSGMNFAGVLGAPTVFLCQNNQWAISCPYDKQTGSETIAAKGEAYGIPAVRVDGNDVLAVYKVVLNAVKRARAGEGPTLIEAVTMRMGGHSTSDDPSRYVPKEMTEEWKTKDPRKRFEAWLISEGHATSEELEIVDADCAEEMASAAKAAFAKSRPPLDTIFSDVYAEIPKHVADQRDWCIGHYSSRGEGVDEKGEFPL